MAASMRPDRLSILLFRIALATLALSGASRAAPVRAEERQVTVLHTTDLHGALTSFDYLRDRPAARGLTRIATMVARARAEGRPVLLLDAGDALSGGPLETVYRGGAMTAPDPMLAAMNAMGYDAFAPGNHEFDLLPPALDRARREARFPWLAANIVRAADGRPAFGASLVRDLGGVRVGIVGVCTPAVPAFVDSTHWPGLRFLSPVDAARAEVERLRSSEHCDLVVLLAHTGFERDPDTGAERRGDTPDENWAWRLSHEVPGVDACVIGHTHVTVQGARFGSEVVTQAGRSGESLGRLDFTLSRESPASPWQVKVSSRVTAVADSIPEDPAIAALAKPFHDATRAALDEVVGEASEDLAAPDGRFSNSALLELIHRAQQSWMGADVSLASLADPAVRIAKGPIRVRDLMRLSPYENTLVTVEMTGADLARTLEQSAAFFQAYTFESGRALPEPGRPGYNFDVARGVTYDIDLTRPAGERIANLRYGGEPLAPGRRLTVVVNSYRANGGGGFDAIARAPRVRSTERTVPALLADLVRRQQTVGGAAEQNWRLLPDYVLSPERPLIDLLVRRGVARPADVLRLGASDAALRGDFAWWLARAWDFRESRHSGAFTDVPDSLEAWLDGLLRHRVLGAQGESSTFRPFEGASLPLALDWCERAALSGGVLMPSAADHLSFRRSLLTGLGRGPDGEGPAALGRGTLTRAEMLGMIANGRFPQLRVLETTDFHGAILGGAPDRRTGRVLGGSAVFAAHVERLRAENPEGTVLLDGGDCFQGTMISNLQFGRPVVEQMNAMRYAAMAVGNHEFDWTVDTLAARVRQMNFAALGANMIEKSTHRLPRWARPDTSFVRRGVRVGVLGLCYRNTPSVTLPANVRHLTFEDDSTAAAREAVKLRRMDRAEVVLGVGHIPAESDSLRHARSGDLLRLARGVRGVDAWFGGHSHNLVLDEANGVPLMIAGSHGQAVAVCDMVWDPKTRAVVEKRSRLVQTWADEVRPDSAMAARVERWNARVKDVAGIRIGTNARALFRNRNGESTVGNLVSDAMREASGADIALQNSGGLRADLPAGDITKASIYEVMPFDNTLVTMELSGADLLRIFEEGLRYGRIAQVSGVRISYDPGRPAMSRVVSLTLADGTPLDPAKTYKVACNNFMATGGDNFDSFSKGRNVVDTGIVIRDALEQYVEQRVRQGAPLDVREDGRVRRLGNSTPPRDDR